MEAPRQGVPRHGKAHRLPGHLQAGGEIKVLGEVELAALLVEDARSQAALPWTKVPWQQKKSWVSLAQPFFEPGARGRK